MVGRDHSIHFLECPLRGTWLVHLSCHKSYTVIWELHLCFQAVLESPLLSWFRRMLLFLFAISTRDVLSKIRVFNFKLSGVVWWQRAWDLHSRSWVRVRACTSCKSLRQPGFYSLTWVHKVCFSGGGVFSNPKKKNSNWGLWLDFNSNGITAYFSFCFLICFKSFFYFKKY
jgi:hypothetical protein